MRRAFTITELIVVIAIIGILLTLLAPSLGTAMHTARRGAAMSNMRQHATQFAAYVGDWQEYPIFTDPGEYKSDVYANELLIKSDVPYFGGRTMWGVCFVDYYGTWAHESMISPARKRYVDDAPASSRLSCSFLAEPNYWRYLRRDGQSQWRAIRGGEVVYPSSKAVLIEWAFDRKLRVESRTLPGIVTTDDGAVHSIPVGDLLPGYDTGEGLGEWTFYGFDVPGLMTIGGVEGRDIP